MSKKNVLYLSYNGLLEPILSSQGIPYMRALAKRLGVSFVLLTWEKEKDLAEKGRPYIEALRRRLREDGIEWFWIKYHKWPKPLSPIYDVVVGMAFSFFLILGKRIGIVHTRGVLPGAIPLFLSLMFRFKIVFDMRGRLAEEYVGGGHWKEGDIFFNLVKWMERALLRSADAVVVLTDKHARLIEAEGAVDAESVPVEVVPCCVDMDHFDYGGGDGRGPAAAALKSELDLEGKFVLLYPGKIGTWYLMEEMLDFFKKMFESVPNAVFLIVTNEDTASLQDTIKENDISLKNVRIASASYDEMPRYLRLADAGIFFINPFQKLGSSPIKLGEFLASGVPVVINPGVGDTEEFVRDKKVGVVVGEFNNKAYQRSVQELLDMRSEGRGVLKERCRRAAELHLSLAKGVGEYARIYERLI